MSDLYQQLKTFGKVKTSELMSKHTTFQIGGKAQFFVVVDDNKKLVDLLNFLSGGGVDYLVLGGGSNLLFSDEDYGGVVIKVHSQKFIANSTIIETDAGVMLCKVLGLAMQNGLTGMEWAAGVPGTVGGAVRGNAGAYGGSTSDNLIKVEVWENGEVKEMAKEECCFNYRGGIFKQNPGMIILRAWFEFKQGDKKEILAKVQDYLKRRSCRFPKYPSAGCVFTNIKLEKWPGDKSILLPKFFEIGEVPAGWLVEQVGAKGMVLGGAKVSDEHGNFIINYNNAKAEDVKNLIDTIKEKVYNKFGVELVFEVEIVG